MSPSMGTQESWFTNLSNLSFEKTSTLNLLIDKHVWQEACLFFNFQEVSMALLKTTRKQLSYIVRKPVELAARRDNNIMTAGFCPFLSNTTK